MKRLLCACLCMLLCAGLFSGCGTTLESDTTVVYVDEKGAVISLDVEELDQDYYDQAELEAFVTDAVEKYTAEHGKDSVKVESLTTEAGIAKLKMKYKTAEDYSDFNGIELYQGKTVTCLAAGYPFDVDFVKVEEGKVVGEATKQDIYADTELKVVIIKANTDVKVAGEICYVSTENVNLTGTDSVSIREGYSLSGGTSEGVMGVVNNESIDGTETAGDGLTENTGRMSESDIAEGVAGAAEETVATEAEPDIFQALMAGNSSFETEVYTYIVYK